MKINTSQILKTYKGKGMTITDENNKKIPFTMKLALNRAINGVEVVNGRVKPLTAEEKGKIYQLSTKLWSKKEVDFTVDDLAFIKKRAGAVSEITSMIYGRIVDVIEKK